MAPPTAVPASRSSAVTMAEPALGRREMLSFAAAAADAIVDEKNVFTLFETGAYPRTGNAAFKDTQKALKAAGKKAVAAAKAGDKAGANAAVKEYIAIGKIKELDTVQGGNFNPKQRRNAGAPPTSEIEAQMGTQAFALYQPLK